MVFPIPTFVGLWIVEEIDLLTIFQFENLNLFYTGLGLILGVSYALIALWVMQAPVFEKLPVRVEKMVKDMKLTFWDCVFLSISAGLGEELLFRSGIQFYLGPIITTVLFVAVHGYLNPFNWRMSLYGLVVIPFIFLISYGFDVLGLWFAVAAHFSYDLILFTTMSRQDV